MAIMELVNASWSGEAAAGVVVVAGAKGGKSSEAITLGRQGHRRQLLLKHTHTHTLILIPTPLCVRLLNAVYWPKFVLPLAIDHWTEVA